MKSSNFKRGYYHPDKGRKTPLAEAALLYARHGKHHLAHIKLIATKGA